MRADKVDEITPAAKHSASDTVRLLPGLTENLPGLDLSSSNQMSLQKREEELFGDNFSFAKVENCFKSLFEPQQPENLLSKGNWESFTPGDHQQYDKTGNTMNTADGSIELSERNPRIRHVIEADLPEGQEIELSFKIRIKPDDAKSTSNESKGTEAPVHIMASICDSGKPFYASAREQLNVTSDWQDVKVHAISRMTASGEMAVQFSLPEIDGKPSKGRVEIKDFGMKTEDAFRTEAPHAKIENNQVSETTAPLKIQVVNEAGQPISGANLSVERHGQPFMVGFEDQALNLHPETPNQKREQEAIRELIGHAGVNQITETPYWDEITKSMSQAIKSLSSDQGSGLMLQSNDADLNMHKERAQWAADQGKMVRQDDLLWGMCVPKDLPNDPHAAEPEIKRHV